MDQTSAIERLWSKSLRSKQQLLIIDKRKHQLIEIKKVYRL